MIRKKELTTYINNLMIEKNDWLEWFPKYSWDPDGDLDWRIVQTPMRNKIDFIRERYILLND